MATQTTYTQYQAPAFAGLIYDMRNITVESYACESATIPFGRAVAPGTNARKQVKLPTGSGQGFRGIALHEQGHAQDLSTGVAAYLQYETVSVLRKGAVWVATSGTVTENSTAYYHASTGLFASAGEATSSGGSRAGVFRQVGGMAAGSGSGLAVVEIDL